MGSSYVHHQLCVTLQKEMTALILACAHGHKAVAELLILKGANVNHRDKVRQVVAVIKWVNLTRASYTPTLQAGFTPLFYAIESGHLDVMELLIERDAQIDLPAKVCIYYIQEWMSVV